MKGRMATHASLHGDLPSPTFRVDAFDKILGIHSALPDPNATPFVRFVVDGEAVNSSKNIIETLKKVSSKR